MLEKPSNAITGRPFCTRAAAMVNCSSPRSERVHIVAPDTNRSSTKSVSGVTNTWPRMPCGRAIRPTSTMSFQSGISTPNLQLPTPNLLGELGVGSWELIPYVQLRLLPVLLRRDRHERSKRRGGPSLPADDLPHVTGRRRQLEHGHATALRLGHPHGVRVIDQRASHDFDNRAQRASRSVAGPGRSRRVGRHYCTAGVSTGAERSRDMWFVSSVRTESDGFAPLLIQYCTRSLLISTLAGFVRGL